VSGGEGRKLPRHRSGLAAIACAMLSRSLALARVPATLLGVKMPYLSAHWDEEELNSP